MISKVCILWSCSCHLGLRWCLDAGMWPERGQSLLEAQDQKLKGKRLGLEPQYPCQTLLARRPLQVSTSIQGCQVAQGLFRNIYHYGRDDNFSMSSALHEVNGKVSCKPCVYRIWCSQMILWVHLISQSFHLWLRSNCSSFHWSLLQRNASYSWDANYLHTGIKALYAVKGWVLGKNTEQESQGSTCFL